MGNPNASKSSSAPLHLTHTPSCPLSHVQSDSTMTAGKDTVHLREVEAFTALSRINILQMKISKKGQMILKPLTLVLD